MRKYLLAIIITLFGAFQAHADAHVNIVHVGCFPELNVLVVEQDLFWGYFATKFVEANPEQVEKKYSFYNIDGLIENDFYGKITAYHPKEIECQLGKDKYQIALLPSTTACQWRQEYYALRETQFRITIKKNNRLLVNKLLSAWGSSGTEIKRIFIDNDENPSMRIEAFPEKYSKFYFLDEADFKTVTTENFYDRVKEKQDGHAVDELATPFCF